MALDALRQRVQPLLDRLGVDKPSPSGRVVEIGWLLQGEAGAFIWDDPKPFPRGADIRACEVYRLLPCHPRL